MNNAQVFAVALLSIAAFGVSGASGQSEPPTLPKSLLGKPPPQETITIELILTKRGTVLLAGNEIAITGLGPSLAQEANAMRAHGKDPKSCTLVIRANPGIRTGNVQQVVKICQKRGFGKFSLRAKLPASKVAAKKTYTNPIIDEIGPADPCVVFFEGKYYLHSTGDNRSYHVYTSNDLVNWTKGPRVFVPGEKNVWAPDVFRCPEDKKFYLYYTVNRRVGVATAERPDGTFVDQGTLVNSAIDAHLFRDDDGKYYLYYVKLPGFRITVQRMKTPLEKQGEPVEIIRPTEPWEKLRGAVTEGPWMLKHRGTYYLMYSGTSASSLDYAIGYATAKSPMGPFTKHPGNPIVKRGAGALGPGHHCVIRDRGGNLWMVYHQQKDGTQPWNRFLCIDPLRFDEKGILHGKATRGTAEPAPVE